MPQSLINKLIARLSGSKQKTAAGRTGVSDRGMVTFAHTGEVIKAQRVLEQSGMQVAVKGPPPHLRTGCDMIIEFPLVEELRVRNILNTAGVVPLQVIPVTEDLLEPVSLYNTKDYGKWLMVRAANMKITVEKSTGTIVNISGGGCPDVPYLAAMLIGHSIDEAPVPKTYGKTLCGYALQLAFEEMVRQCHG